MIYQWRPGSRFAVDAETAGAELERIRSSRAGNLRPSDVVEESRPDGAPLHPCFEWDEERAALKWNEHQARQIIHSVVEVHYEDGQEDQAKATIAYVHMTPDEGGQGYRRTQEVVADHVLRARMLEEALGFLHGARRRYEHLSELAEVFAALDRVAATKAKGKAKKKTKARVPARAR